MTRSAPVVPAASAPAASTLPSRRRLLGAALGALLLLGFAAHPPVLHTPAAFLANDGTKTGTGGG